MSISIAQRVVDPVRLESRPRQHEFHQVESFAAYLKVYGGDNSVVMMDVAQMKGSAVLDETVTEGRERLDFLPPTDPRFSYWEDRLLTGQLIPLESLINTLIRGRSAIVEPDGRELGLMLTQLTIGKKVTMKRGVGAKSVNGLMVETVIQGQSKTEQVPLPGEFIIEAPLILHTDPVRITFEMTAMMREDEVFFVVAAPDLLDTKLSLFHQLADEIGREIDSVGFGVLHYGDWDYVAGD